MMDEDLTLQEEGEKPSRVDGRAERLIMAKYEEEAHQKSVCQQMDNARRMLLVKEIAISIAAIAVTWYAVRTWLFADWAKGVEQMIVSWF